MSYFAPAFPMLLAGQGLMVPGYGYPAADMGAPETLVLVHVVAIGWLSLLMAGALLQFVPVLIARPLVGGHLAAPALVLPLAGLGFLVAGFVALSGATDLPLLLLPVGGAMLLAGFGLVAGILAVTLFAARPLQLPARFVAVGLTCLVIAVLVGAAFTLALSGLGDSVLFARLVAEGLGLHATLGLRGRLSIPAGGGRPPPPAPVPPPPPGRPRPRRAVWWTAGLAIGLVAACIPLVALSLPGASILFPAALVLALAAVALYGGDIRQIYQARKRKRAELNIRATFPAFAALVVAIALVNVPAVRTGDNVAALVYLFVFGWLTGLGLAQLYKIVAFLTWLEAYGPILGRAPVPRVQDLVEEGHTRILFRIYYGAVAAATVALFWGTTDIFRGVACLQLVVTVALMREFIRTRRLSVVPAALRAPDGMVQPHLFLPLSVPRR